MVKRLRPKSGAQHFIRSSKSLTLITMWCSHASWLPLLLKSLQQGGHIVVLQQDASSAPVIAEMTLSGFVDGCSLDGSVELQGAAYKLVCAKRPLWEIGAKASLKRKPANPAAETPAPLISTWSIAASKDAEDLVDEVRG
jgi:hypothetical protein